MDKNTWEYDYSNLYNTPAQDTTYHYAAPAAANAEQAGGAPAAPKKKKGKAALRVLAGFLCLVLVAGVGFGGGYLGSVVAINNMPEQKTVVVQSAVADGTGDTVSPTVSGNLSVSDIAAQAGPSVVAIDVQAVSTGGGFFGGGTTQSGAGSGVIISEDGYIVTNHHVIDGATSIKVTTPDGTEYEATVVGSDATADVAVIKVDASGLTAAVIGDSDDLRVGDTAVAIGNPLGTLSGTVTSGIVSALNREVTVENVNMTLIQTSASVNPGNSGGGLFNDKGQLVGMVNAGATSAEGVGFAIPINTVMEVAQDLIANGRVTTRPAMGVTVVSINDAQTAMQAGVSSYGVYIQSVTSGSAAEKAGLQAGDLFISIDGETVADTADIGNILAKHEIGDEVAIQVARERQIVSVTLTLQASV